MRRLQNYIIKLLGEFGEKLKQNIDTSTPKHFILNSNKNCPFLNDKKLCEIYINLGKDSLCKICAEHPRYYEWFDDVKEGGIGLCCEEACRIILSDTHPFSTCEIEIPYENAENYDIEIYNYIYTAREKIISYLGNTSLPFNSRIRDVLWYCYTIQQNIDSGLLDDEDIFPIKAYSQPDLQSVLEFLLTLETNSADWSLYLKDCISLYKNNAEKFDQFYDSHPEILQYLQNISIYFVWRYFLKSVFDEDVLSKIKLMVVSVAVLKSLYFCTWVKKQNLTIEDCIEITKKYSEEIEYSEENLYKLADASYKLDIFSTENLISLFL